MWMLKGKILRFQGIGVPLLGPMEAPWQLNHGRGLP